MEIEGVTQKLNDTEKKEVIPEGSNSQTNPCTEIHNDRVNEELFETPKGGGITRESITLKTNSKSRSTQIRASKVAALQKRDSVAK